MVIKLDQRKMFTGTDDHAPSSG